MSALVTFVHGDQAPVDYTPSSAVSAGDVVVQNELVGYTTRNIAADALGSLVTGGVADWPKDSGSSSAIEAGKDCYWDAGNEVATETAGSNKLIGKCVLAADDDDTTVRIKSLQ